MRQNRLRRGALRRALGWGRKSATGTLVALSFAVAVLAAPVILAGSSAVLRAAATQPAIGRVTKPGGAAHANGPGSPSQSGHSSQTADVATIDVGRLPTSVAVDPAMGTVWVVNSLDGTLSEISARRRDVIATVKVGVSPVDVAVDPRTGTVWVTCLGPFDRPAADNLVDEVSETSKKVIARFKVGLDPFGIAVDSHTGTVWVADSGSQTVSEISEARQAVVASLHTGAGSEPVGVAVDPIAGIVWVASPGGLVQEIRAATLTVTGSVKVRPDSPAKSLNAIAAYPGTDSAWIASDSYVDGGYVSYASAVPRAASRIGRGVVVSKPDWSANIADGIAVDPATSTVWVAENGGNTVTMISAGAGQVARNLVTGPGPVAVAVDSQNGTVWVVDNTASTVTEFSYARPEFTTSSQVRLTPGRHAVVQVHTRGFPIAVMSVRGALPPGMRVRVGAGTVSITGRPAAFATGRTFRVSVLADNGVGTANGQYSFTQQLIIQVGGPARAGHR
jgi:YVTN family beta-propeller protein